MALALGWRLPRASYPSPPCPQRLRVHLNSPLWRTSDKSKLWARAMVLIVLFWSACGISQEAPPSPDRPWHSAGEQGLQAEGRSLRPPESPLDYNRNYSLGDLIDLAETHTPETRCAWERARAQAATLGLARSELYPTLAATALSQLTRGDVFFGGSFYRHTIGELEGRLALSYTVFDFGARAGRINAAKAQLLAANSSFNDAHRQVIYQVEQAYYQLLNSVGQLAAAQASLTNAQTVQQAAEERLQNGLATLPDVLEARSAAAQAEYELQAALGATEIGLGNLAMALGAMPSADLRVQPLSEVVQPDSIGTTVDEAIHRAFARRPDLMQHMAEIRSADA